MAKKVVDTGSPIQIPIGRVILGLLKVSVTRMLIHCGPPTFVEQLTTTQVLETGIKMVDLLAPYARGGKIGLSGAGWKDGVDSRTYQQCHKGTQWFLHLLR